MKDFITGYFLFCLGVLAVISCDDEARPRDEIYEFVAFKGQPVVNLNEQVNSAEPFPLVVELKAFEPYKEDIQVQYAITATNAAAGTDFTVSPAGSVTIRAGRLVSDTIFVQTIDNGSGSTLERSFEIAISSVSREGIRIGLGITEPKNSGVTVNILDDECSETIAIFNTTSLTNTLDWGGGDVVKPAAGVVSGNTVTVTGDLIDYGPFANASVTITLEPEIPGSTKGTATFGEQVGTDSDGWEYKFIQTGEGTYDVCSGVIEVAYDIYYLDGDWVYWYSVTNRFSVN